MRTAGRSKRSLLKFQVTLFYIIFSGAVFGVTAFNPLGLSAARRAAVCIGIGGIFYFMLIKSLVRQNQELLDLKMKADLAGASNLSLLNEVDKQNTQLLESQNKAEAALEAKSKFLFSMSREIRGPANAIIGMSELALGEELPQQAREHVGNIQQAGENLLSIIDDILDFAEIESGEMEIVQTEYELASVINDVINIIRIRTNGKPILFVTKIDGTLPARLCGDEVRIRQVLLNLLGNAVKYTDEGSITLVIRGEDMPSSVGPTDFLASSEQSVFWHIRLFFEVADTGIGVKSEDIGKLFGEFVRFDVKQNREIEGTGMGLAISRSICRLMGGDITVTSVHGEGSVFTASIPQKIRDIKPFALVEKPETKNVLVYETRRACAESIGYTLVSLGVGCALAYTHDDFIERLSGAPWQFVIAASSLLDEARAALKKNKSSPVLVLLAGVGDASLSGIHTLAMPVHPAALADILNGKAADIIAVPS